MEKLNELNGVHTFKWDTTYTTTYEVMNRQIAKHSSYPAEFNNQTQLADLKKSLLKANGLNHSLLQSLFRSNDLLDQNITISGQWNQWKLDLQGNGNVIFLLLPVESGTIEFNSEMGDLSDGYLIVQVKLQVIQKNENKKKSIVLDFTQGDFEVTIYDHSFPKILKESILDLLVESVFKNYLNSKKAMEEFKHIFATVSINDKATGDFAWLKPSDLSYAVFCPDFKPTESNSLYSILCMTENKKADPQAQKAVDSEVFTGKTPEANAVLCISPQSFCKHLLIESSKKLIKGTVDSDYAYSTDGTEVHNINEIIFKDVEFSGNQKENLKIAAGNYSIRIINDHLEVNITNASFSKTLYTAYISFIQRIKFETKDVEGKTIFIPKTDDLFKGKTMVTVQPTTTAEVIKWIGVGIDILSGILLLAGAAVKVAAKVTTTATTAIIEVGEVVATSVEVAEATSIAAKGIAEGVTKGISISSALVIAGSVSGLIGSAFTLTPEIAIAIAKKDYEKIPTLDSFAMNFLSEVSWTGIKEAKLIGARLNDAFLMDFKIN